MLTDRALDLPEKRRIRHTCAMVSKDASITTLTAMAWAKSDPMGRPPSHWLPLWQHLDDAGAVAGHLWDAWLAPSVRRLVSSGLPDGDADGRRLVSWLAGVHDIGKVSPAFAIQAAVLCDRMIGAGYRPPGVMVQHDRARLRHERAGAVALASWLGERYGYDERASDQFAAVVAGHHGQFPDESSMTVDGEESLYGEGRWEGVRCHLLDRAAERFEVIDRLDAWRAASFSRPAQMAVTGLVIMADWIASAADYFPLLPVDVVPAVPEASADDERVAFGLKRLDLSPPWRPTPGPHDVESLFADRFPHIPGSPRPVQDAVAKAAGAMPVPGLMIVEAPMGEGKTEAAFLAAEILAERSGATGCLVALPTQATSNAMFARMLDWLNRLPDAGGGNVSVALVHGKAALNDEYQDIRFPSRSVVDQEAAHEESGPTVQRLLAVVDEWMTGRKRAALSSFVVGTIDQVLFAALKARHVMLRQLALVGKVVILDEVHAADVYMARFLDRALEWLGASGVCVVLLSATLPPDRRAALYAAYESGRRGSITAVPRRSATEDAAVDRLLGYPSIVTSGDDEPTIVELEPSGRRTEVRVSALTSDHGDDLDALVALLRERLRDGGCAVVIRNTVRRVQEAAQRLADEFGAETVTVAHAQFLACDRIENDARLLSLFGPPGGPGKRPETHIVVASQVVEQSLDVDFDLMVTDTAPVDLLLQRMGRLHRHRRELRPEPLRQAQCWITGFDAEPPSSQGPVLDRGACAVYGRYRLLAALAVLAPHFDGAQVRLPEDIAPLVAQAYGPLDPPVEWEDDWEAARTADEAAADKRKGLAGSYLLGSPTSRSGSLLGSMRAGLGAVDDESPQGQQCVRDGGESIEVVVVQRVDGVDRIPGWVAQGAGEMLPFRDQIVDVDLARALARCTLRLPFALSHEGIVDQTITDLEANYFPGWDKSPFLSGNLALVLGEERSADLSRHRVTYDQRFGLMVTDRE